MPRARRLLLVPLLLLAACATHAPLPERALVDVTMVRQAIQYQKDADAHASTPAPAGTPWFEVLRGTAPVIVTAPHATKPFREGTYRFADGGGTAALARMLHTLTNATALYVTYESPSDPNYYDDNAFKAELARLIAEVKPVLLLDIHASHAWRPYDVDLGTMHGASLLGDESLATGLADALRTEGLMNLSSNYFPAAKSLTITKFAAARGVPAIQLEINATWLAPAQGDLQAHRFAQLLQAVTRFVRNRAPNRSGN